MVLSVAVVAMLAGLVIGLVLMLVPRAGSPLPTSGFVRFAAVAGVLSAGAGAMYIVHRNGGGAVSLIVADAMMVLPPALMAAAVRLREERSAIGVLSLAAMAGVVVAMSSTFLPEASSTTVKAGVLAIASMTCAVVAARATRPPGRPLKLLALTMGAFALFSAARAATGGFWGWESPIGRTAFSFGAVVVVSTVAVMLTGLSIVLLLRPTARGTGAGASERTIVTVADWSLASAAYGLDRVRDLVIELRLAASELDSTAVETRHGVDTALPSAVLVLGDRLRTGYGWRPEEVALIADTHAATTTVRVVRPIRWLHPRD